jgi:hypothetical protein
MRLNDSVVRNFYTFVKILYNWLSGHKWRGYPSIAGVKNPDTSERSGWDWWDFW